MRKVIVVLPALFPALLFFSVIGCNRTSHGERAKNTESAASRTKRDAAVPIAKTPDAKQPARTRKVIGVSAKWSTGRPLPSDHPLHQKWPRPILTAVLSPDGKTAAIHDDTGVFLSDQRGGHVRRVNVTLHENLANEQVSVFFAFRPDGCRVAILTRLIYGEPMGAFIERLWTADATTGCSRRLSEWMDRVQGSGPIVADRKIDGWTSDGESIIVSGTIYEGEDMPVVEVRRTGTERVVIKDRPCR